MAAGVHHHSRELDPWGIDQPASGSRQALGRDSRLVHLSGDAQRNPAGVEVRASANVKVGPDAQPHARHPTGAVRRCDDELDLAGCVQRNSSSRGDGAREELLGL